MKKDEHSEKVHFYDKDGNVVFSVPGSMTLEEWKRLGYPRHSIVPNEQPWKDNEARIDSAKGVEP